MKGVCFTLTYEEKIIPWCPRYTVSNDGVIRSYIGQPKILKQHITAKGYSTVKLSFEPTEKGKYYQKEFKVHRLVAELFCKGFEEEKEVHHKDLNRLNNNADNLLCLTKQEHIELHKKLKAKEQDKNAGL